MNVIARNVPELRLVTPTRGIGRPPVAEFDLHDIEPGSSHLIKCDKRDIDSLHKRVCSATHYFSKTRGGAFVTRRVEGGIRVWKLYSDGSGAPGTPAPGSRSPFHMDIHEKLESAKPAKRRNRTGYEIRKDVPLPTRHAPVQSKYPFPIMQVGDSFVVDSPDHDVRIRSNLQSAANSFVKRLLPTSKFSIRKIEGGFGVWRIR